MHLALSSIGGTREEQLCILSAVLLWGVVAWLFTVRAARKTNNNITANDNNLEAPLLEDEPKHAIRSRVRLASRQAAYYVLVPPDASNSLKCGTPEKSWRTFLRS